MAEYIEREALLSIVGAMPLSWEYGKAVSDIYDIIKAQPAADVVERKRGEWISVEERLPEVNQLVLCYKYNGSSHYKVGFFIGAKYTEDVAAFRNINELFSFGATHWMPLPEPPNCGADMRGEEAENGKE